MKRVDIQSPFARRAPQRVAPQVQMHSGPAVPVGARSVYVTAAVPRDVRLETRDVHATLFAPTKRPAGTSKTKESGTASALDRFAPLFRRGIQDLNDLTRTFELIDAVGPRWRAMVEAFEVLRAERSANGTPFEITLGNEGTFCRRTGEQSRATELAAGIAIDRGQPLFAVVHELIGHGLPLTHTDPELAALPYVSSSELLKNSGGDFESIFTALLEEYYSDEAIAGLAEALFLEDLERAGFDVRANLHAEEYDHLSNSLRVYRTEGVHAYLRSECYIGRNHRKDYQVA